MYVHVFSCTHKLITKQVSQPSMYSTCTHRIVTYLRSLSSDDPLMVICERRERGGGRGERERWKSEEGGKVGGEVGGRGDKGMKRLD